LNSHKYDKDQFVDALRARLREVAPEIRRSWNADDLENWRMRVKSDPGSSGDDTPDVSRFVSGMCSDLFGPNADE
jgi:hypothetical protein